MENKPPYTSIAIIILLVALLCFALFNPTKSNLIKVQQRIDTLTARKDTIIKKAAVKSKTYVQKADKLTKSLPRETPKINDTTYAAMCEYIANYRPGATIDAE